MTEVQESQTVSGHRAALVARTGPGPAPGPSAPSPLLQIEELSVRFRSPDGDLLAVDRVSLQVGRGETVALVGESGCGKSVTARAVLGLLPSPPALVTARSLLLAGEPLLGRRERELARLRGRQVGFVFQEPLAALNPVVRVGVQIMEGPRHHLGLSRGEARQRALELLRGVGLPEPEAGLAAYPHQLSGGMRQRVMLAVALSSDPELLIADEPTTALDVTVQAQILRLLDELRRSRGLGLLLITHDLGVVAEVADRVVVLYGGLVVEEAPVRQLFAHPSHPYTRALLAVLPRPDAPARGEARPRLPTIPGQVPSPAAWPPGCRFGPRCPLALPACHEPRAVPLVELGGGQRARCLRAGGA